MIKLIVCANLVIAVLKTRHLSMPSTITTRRWRNSETFRRYQLFWWALKVICYNPLFIYLNYSNLVSSPLMAVAEKFTQFVKYVLQKAFYDRDRLTCIIKAQYYVAFFSFYINVI